MEKKRIYKKSTPGSILFYGTPAHGHINPTLPIVTEFVKRGYTVIYYATEEFRGVIEQCGAKFRAYSFGVIEFTPRIGSRILDLAEVILRFTDEQMAVLLAQAKEIDPVLILHDTIAFWGRAVSHILGIKAASVNPIITTYQYRSKTFRMYALRFAGRSLLEGRAIPGIVRHKKNLERRYHLKKTDLLNLLMNGEALNIFTYPRLVHPEGDKLGKDCFFLGASAILRQDISGLGESCNRQDISGLAKDCNGRDAYGSVESSNMGAAADCGREYRRDLWERIGEERTGNLIYVSLGTIFNDCLSFYKTVFSALGNSGYSVVVSCGEQYDTLSGWEIPENIFLRRYVDQRCIFEYAVLFITAGGMNSICEAAANGVPCLIYPQQGEQGINAEAFERLGLGKIRRKKQDLLEACRSLIDSFQPNPQRMREFSSVHMEELMCRIEKYAITEEG